MENALGQWSDLIPDVYKWVGSVNVKYTDDIQNADLTVVPVARKDERIEFSRNFPLSDLKTKIEQAMVQAKWKGETNSANFLIDGRRVLLVVKSSLDTRAIQKSRQIGIDTWNFAKDYNFASIAFLGCDDLNSSVMFEGYAIASYNEGFMKQNKKTRELVNDVRLYETGSNKANLDRTKSLIKACVASKLLQDAPPNWANPERFLQVAEYIVSQNSKIELTVLTKEQLQSQGLGSMLSVAKGSDYDGKLICLKIAGKDTSRTIALIGKGVTFDSGGINLKPSQAMAEMKYDMSGAAAVLSSAMVLSDHQPPTNVICAVGAVENMPSGRASRPGDVVKSYSGKTIEILNTDAEGRLVLADVISWVTKKYSPEFIVDIATLTGAVLYGLGHAGAGFLSHQETAARYFQEQADNAGEPVWRLPLWPELGKETKSDIADLKNIAKPDVLAGTIMGAWFLREFIEDRVKGWVHMDIAGTGWSCSATGYPSSGGSAFGIRTMLEMCYNFPTWDKK
ncbi:MAG: M17 family metallopeptidase [Oligoflexales bacterium]